MEYTEDQLTEWFDVDKQKPWEPGVYLVKSRLDYATCVAFWDGIKFGFAVNCEDDFQGAVQLIDGNANIDSWQVTKWRGLSSDPSAPKKRAGNKRKTMYVVMDKMEIDKPLGCFMCEIVARNFASKFKWAEVEKIRFRTPEA